MVFSAKSCEQMISDIRTQWERHRCDLVATDSIMSRDHLKHALPTLAAFASRPAVFYEMKANVTEEEVKQMSRASIYGQVGIESLSSRLLKLMNKGVTSIRVIALLKWCAEQHVDIVWNELCGIPGETEEDYDQQIALMEKIPHFAPPNRVNPILIDRFSPYFNRYREFGWSRIDPVPQYRAAHPNLTDKQLFDIAYHFQGVDGVSTAPYIERFTAAVERWKMRHKHGDGLFVTYDGLVRIENSIPTAVIISEQVRRIIECTHTIVAATRVGEQTGCKPTVLKDMVDSGILYMEKNNVINLTARVRT
jgi:hypothetical protein